MKLIGVTGGVGMGKSAAQQFLAERGVAVVDTDAIARELVQPGQPALAEVASVFGSHHLTQDGELRRGSLGAVIFEDPEARRRLEAILHPPIRQRWMAKVADWRADCIRCGAIVIPLLFETRVDSSFDVTVCVACSQATQLARLAQRGWTEQESRRRVEAQLPTHDKMTRADRVVWTEGQLEAHAAQWDCLLGEWL